MTDPVSLSLPALSRSSSLVRYHGIPKRYDETRPVLIQGNAHRKIIGYYWFYVFLHQILEYMYYGKVLLVLSAHISMQTPTLKKKAFTSKHLVPYTFVRVQRYAFTFTAILVKCQWLKLNIIFNNKGFINISFVFVIIIIYWMIIIV